VEAAEAVEERLVAGSSCSWSLTVDVGRSLAVEEAVELGEVVGKSFQRPAEVVEVVEVVGEAEGERSHRHQQQQC
jgi:hypothetical protein